jgi:hypothetical protein
MFPTWRYCLESDALDKRGDRNDIHESQIRNRAIGGGTHSVPLLLMRQPHRRIVIAITLLQVH